MPSLKRILPTRRATLTVVAMAVSLVAFAQSPPDASPPLAGIDGTIHIWGHGHLGQDYILTLLRAWEGGFRKTHPAVQFDNALDGDSSAMGGLYTRVADLAVLDREASFIEVDAYQQGAGYAPFRIPVARGSVATPHHAPALKILVNRANPLAQLTMQQLDGIFDADHRRGDRTYKTWGDLGLTGEWASRPIKLYTYEVQSEEVQFFERVALKGSQKLACGLTPFHSEPGLTPSLTVEQQIQAAVARDKYGLALATLPAPALKPVPLAEAADTPAVLPIPAAITGGTYPLARTVYVYANRTPKSAVPANVAAFLDYIVSPAGQEIVARTGGYLPLGPELAAQAREALK